jgi:hypothetical protein
VSAVCDLSVGVGGARTVDVDVALLHEPAQLREPLGGVDLGHVDGTQGGRRVECSGGARQGVLDSDSDSDSDTYMYTRAPWEAREHGGQRAAGLCSVFGTRAPA